MEDFTFKQKYDINDLRIIMALLRSGNGCPWDREQNHLSIKKNMIEEAYEAAQAITDGDNEALCEELGDVLLQVVFHSQMASEENSFDFDSVCDTICKKLIHRHPHVFSDTSVSGSGDVLKNWNEIKKKEKNQKDISGVMEGIAGSLPALMRGQKIVKAAAREKLIEIKKTEDRKAAEEKIVSLIREAVDTAVSADIDAEEVFGDYLNEYIKSLKN